jgi:hypothetical protein
MGTVCTILSGMSEMYTELWLKDLIEKQLGRWTFGGILLKCVLGMCAELNQFKLEIRMEGYVC